MVRLWIKDNTTGEVHEYGTSHHDALVLQEDGSLHYLNLQSCAGTMFPEEGYSFCSEDGSVPSMFDITGGEEYLDIGGTKEFIPVVHAKWIPSGTFDDFAECSACGNRDHTLHTVHGAYSHNRYNFCPHCGAKISYREP